MEPEYEYTPIPENTPIETIVYFSVDGERYHPYMTESPVRTISGSVPRVQILGSMHQAKLFYLRKEKQNPNKPSFNKWIKSHGC